MRLSASHPVPLDLLLSFGQIDPTRMTSTSKEVFFFCIREGNADFVRAVLTLQPGLINQCDKWLRGPLHIAAAYGARRDVMEVLLDSGADLLQQDLDGSTALHICAKHAFDNFEVLQLMARKGGPAIFEVRDNAGATPIDYLTGATAVHEALLHLYGIEGDNQAARYGPRASYWRELEEELAGTTSRRPCTLELFIEMVENVGGVNARRPGQHLTPLHIATREGWPDFVKWLLERGADPNACTRMPDGRLGFPCIVFARDLESMGLLLAQGANPLARCRESMRALDVVAYLRPFDIFAQALDKALDLAGEPADMGPAILLALIGGRFDSVRRLLTREGWQSDPQESLAKCLCIALEQKNVPDDIMELLRSRVPLSMAQSAKRTFTLLIPEEEAPYMLFHCHTVPSPVSEEQAAPDDAPLPEPPLPRRDKSCILV